MSAADSGAITREEVARLARLARLAVTEDELDVFAGQLDVILGAVARVGEVAADDIPPTSHAVPLLNVFRPDERRLPRSRQRVSTEQARISRHTGVWNPRVGGHVVFPVTESGEIVRRTFHDDPK